MLCLTTTITRCLDIKYKIFLKYSLIFVHIFPSVLYTELEKGSINNIIDICKTLRFFIKPSHLSLLLLFFSLPLYSHQRKWYWSDLEMVCQLTNVWAMISWEWHGRPLQRLSCKTSHVLCARPAPLSLYVMGSPCLMENATGLTHQSLLHQKVLKSLRLYVSIMYIPHDWKGTENILA